MKNLLINNYFKYIFLISKKDRINYLKKLKKRVYKEILRGKADNVSVLNSIKENDYEII